MFGKQELNGAPAPTDPAQPRPDANARKRGLAPGDTLPAEADRNIPMLGAIRMMLGLAVEAAFDLRSGHGDNRNLDRFEEMLDEQMGLLDSLENGDFTSDTSLLTHHAHTALDGFATAVRQEIVQYVSPGVAPVAFDAALQRMTDRAVLAGVAFASLDHALDRPL